MLHLTYALNNQELSPRAFSNYLNTLPLSLQDTITKYHRWQDSQACLFGKLLLQHTLCSYQSQYTLNDILFTDKGKPYFGNGFDINISHSGSYVICAYFDNGRVGVDLEEVNKVELSDFKINFSDDEFNEIKSSNDKYASFYSFWTIKEAAIKADGRGLHIPLKNVEVQGANVFIEGDKWYYQKIDFQRNYILHVVTDKFINTPVQLQPIDFYGNVTE